MNNCFLIFPNQLFQIKHIEKYIKYDIFIIEDTLFFSDKERIVNFNKLKLVLHSASMKYYHDYLTKNKCNVQYINFNKLNNQYKFLKNYTKITTFHPEDHLLKKRLDNFVLKHKIKIIYIENPLFLLSQDDLDEYIEHKGKTKTFYHKNFYDWQINKLNIPYIDKSYDKMNRNSIPNDIQIPNSIRNKNDNNTIYVKEAKKYIQKHFKNNYGNVVNFFYPVTHKTANIWLIDFIKNRLEYFGTYQDAILENQPFLFHSLLSSLINIGLLTPSDVLKQTINYYEKNKNKIQINNFEGFIRQLVGWREYMRMLYVKYYDQLITSNYFNNTKKLDKRWYNGTFGILPVDNTIKRAFKYGYLHHIERLMIMLNFMGLVQIHPNQIYKWFMEFSVDSYDWVMIGNVYGMGYHNTNIMRKPYISTSNYIIKMSNYKPDGVWDKVWTALFYKFLVNNKDKLKGGAAFYLRNLSYFQKKTKKQQEEMLDILKIIN